MYPDAVKAISRNNGGLYQFIAPTEAFTISFDVMGVQLATDEPLNILQLRSYSSNTPVLEIFTTDSRGLLIGTCGAQAYAPGPQLVEGHESQWTRISVTLSRSAVNFWTSTNISAVFTYGINNFDDGYTSCSFEEEMVLYASSYTMPSAGGMIRNIRVEGMFFL
jgi:hypothetical protein